MRESNQLKVSYILRELYETVALRYD